MIFIFDLDETLYVEKNFVLSGFKVVAKYLNVNLIFSESSNRFITALKGVTDPEQKRKIIGNEFINVFDEE